MADEMTGCDALFPPVCESDSVEMWRLHVLVEAGYSVQVAERLAVASHVDLHRAVELVQAGCRPALAALILL